MRGKGLDYLRPGAALGVLLLAATANAASLTSEAGDAQRQQAELQAQIDAADDESRAMLAELRERESETRRLEQENARLVPHLVEQAEQLRRREAALDTLDATRQALPSLQASLVARLDTWVEDDLPFMQEQRRARVASLERALGDPDLDDAERMERILDVWRLELAYGMEMDAWRDHLVVADDSRPTRREVDYLRLGRIGLYYLTPDGREGGAWLAEEADWAPLDDQQRREVRKGLRMARDQRAPELLQLPVSQPLERENGPLSGEGGA
ncbi:Protein of unknown function [Franzmannia pantelleriensis]|uniref:DUF3450 domain-containing protein n=1 Tax=Franzmannia pantelleriensis TaxID=48727 RepID=A0A1G9UAC0_9GAMM|nr:DUF3450 domain-containing protein [Halomonas pantelleriensis]SDM56936.1 Protein of unknown function [Halomonas pantelleriensis]